MNESVICPKCHNERNSMIKRPCEFCGARKTLIGYLYSHEYNACLTALLVVVSASILALCAGAGFLAYLSSQLIR